ncbi:MAG: hypothetical protein IT318_15210, partial [Anaerolineales bacterium]|nr:hypothetical protein [Anaerolineales bacterium]
MRKGLLSGIVVIGLLPAVWGRAAPLRAQAAALFTVTVSSAYLRAAPDLAAARTYSVFQGGTYAVTGRTADSAWVSLAYTAANKGTWIPVSYGDVAGRLADVPVLGAAAVAPAPTSLPGAPRVTPTPGPTPLVDSLPAAAPAGPVRQQLTLTVNSAYVRAAPSWSATRLASLFRPAVVGVTGRDRYGNWLQIASSPPGWVPAGVGSLSGPLMELPVAGAPAMPTAAVPAGEPPD